MRKLKILCIGSLALGLLIVGGRLLGLYSLDYSDYRQISQIKRAMKDQDYDKVQESYSLLKNKGISSEELDYNYGLSLYNRKEYAGALEIFETLRDVDYLLLGNSAYRISAGTQEQQSKIETLEKAIDYYKQGIIKDYLNLDLKINYELALKELEALKDQQNQDNSQDNNDQQSNEDSQENDNGDKSQENDNGDKQNNNQDSGDDQQQENQEQNEQQQGDKENKDGENQEESQQEKSQQENSENNPEQNQGKEGDKEESTEQNPEDAMVQQVLRMLEEQEKESLKNNQSIYNGDKGDENDW